MNNKLNNDIKNKLLDLLAKDQEMRKNPNISISDVEEFDKKSTEILKKIIKKIGWPTISKVGEEAAHAAWVISQHTKDEDFLNECMLLMRKNIDDISKKDLAYIEDRVSLSKNGYQIYGTLVKSEEKNGKLVTELLPVKDLKNLNKLRSEMGLDSLEDQLKRCEEVYLMYLKDKK